MEADEHKVQAVADAMAVGLEYVESLQVGRRTPPELADRFAAADAAVLTPIKAMLGLDRVGWAGSASAPMPLETARFFAGLGFAIYDIYGMTETTGSVTACGPGSFRLGTVGRAQPGIEIRIAGDGEILARGPVTTTGYHQNPEATAALVDADGWVHTGDIGELDADGFVTITGRKKELIVTAGGKNVAPAVLEDRLRAHRLISQAVVVGDQRPYIGALITIDPEADTTGADVEAEVTDAIKDANKAVSKAEAIKAFRILDHDFTIEADELTPSLKLKRHVIMKKYADEIEALYAGRATSV
jgi:long-chain acyl-CoA synthetase